MEPEIKVFNLKLPKKSIHNKMEPAKELLRTFFGEKQMALFDKNLLVGGGFNGFVMFIPTGGSDSI